MRDLWKSSSKPLIDKLGVKPGARVTVLGIADVKFWKELQERTRNVARGRRKGEDCIFLGADRHSDLSQLQGLVARLKREGAIWVVLPRGRQDIKDSHAMAAAKAAGLVDVKVVHFSETHTALKLVIPLARR